MMIQGVIYKRVRRAHLLWRLRICKCCQKSFVFVSEHFKVSDDVNAEHHERVCPVGAGRRGHCLTLWKVKVKQLGFV